MMRGSREGKLTVVGAGSWGTAMSVALSGNFSTVSLWAHSESTRAFLSEKRENSVYLPGVSLPENVVPTGDLEEALSGGTIVLFALPTQHTREIATQAAPLIAKTHLVSLSKGMETGSFKRVSEILEEEIGDATGSPVSVLSGPTFAKEVAAGKPAAATIASRDFSEASELQQRLSTRRLRLYADGDVKGVEIGGAVKNVIAIATGIADGLEFGFNARAALITRGLAEMKRLGEALGAAKETFHGLAGMGDLILTCTGELSRNRTFGFRIGQGETPETILGSMKMVAEGVKTSWAVNGVRDTIGLDMPISEQVHHILYHGKKAHQAVAELLSRSLKREKE